MSDADHRARALALAEQGRCTTRPNPAVGAVVVRDGEVLSADLDRMRARTHEQARRLWGRS